MEPCIPFPIPDETLREIVDNATDFAMMNGACMRPRDAESLDKLQVAPYILIPSSYPRKEFEKAVKIQPLINLLTHRVAHDYTFLKETLANTLAVDSFTAKLFEIYETVRSEGIAQPTQLGMLRSDVMLDTYSIGKDCCNHCDGPSDCAILCAPYCCWKQVEVNTIASGFGWMGPVATMIHRYVFKLLGHPEKIANIPENKALEGLAEGMLKAWEIYDQPKAVIMFLVEEEMTINICDQRYHEFEIRKQNPDVQVIRRNFKQVFDNGHLDEHKKLIVDGMEVAVVYFRCGYDPEQYPTESHWEARLMIERSMAIKAPSIHYHLAGTKKVQQQLATKGCLEKFIQDPEEVADISQIFTGLYSLDMNSDGDAAEALVRCHPDNYVLKPQREGGGNNVYGEDIIPVLDRMREEHAATGSQERAQYILMERLKPPEQTTYMVRPNTPVMTVSVISELGIFGYIIGDSDKIYENKSCGHTLRTKVSTANEGGVSHGLGALDSPYLVDQ